MDITKSELKLYCLSSHLCMEETKLLCLELGFVLSDDIAFLSPIYMCRCSVLALLTPMICILQLEAENIVTLLHTLEAKLLR